MPPWHKSGDCWEADSSVIHDSDSPVRRAMRLTIILYSNSQVLAGSSVKKFSLLLKIIWIFCKFWVDNLPACLEDEQLWLSDQGLAALAVEFVNDRCNRHAVPLSWYNSSLPAMTEDDNNAHLAVFMLRHISKFLDVFLHIGFALIFNSLALGFLFLLILNRAQLFVYGTHTPEMPVFQRDTPSWLHPRHCHVAHRHCQTFHCSQWGTVLEFYLTWRRPERRVLVNGISHK